MRLCYNLYEGLNVCESNRQEERKRSYLRDNKEYWCALSNESLRDWSISVCKSFKQTLLFSCMLCNLCGVWMFENQTEEGEEKLSLQEITKSIDLH